MLTITVPKNELFNEDTNEFIDIPETTLCLEHSLISLSKWEMKWNKAFLSKRNKKTEEEVRDYVRFMTVSPTKVDSNVYLALTKANVNDIFQYINAPMTAVYFPEDPSTGPSGDTPTTELIYYWMISYGIPFECQKWHLNRLMSLIRVCQIKNEAANPKKGRHRRSFSERRALNESRLKKYNTAG